MLKKCNVQIFFVLANCMFDAQITFCDNSVFYVFLFYDEAVKPSGISKTVVMPPGVMPPWDVLPRCIFVIIILLIVLLKE